ncbi:MAG: hypothetical protein LBD88_04210 [Candidatus Peribacteria bacterium]|nr:hypothetical protein [Candidatus Peribacteria bacterium]
MLDKQKTIKELKENIEELDKVKTELTTIKDFVLDKTIEPFLRKNLNRNDYSTIEKIAKEYNETKNVLEANLIEASKNLLDTTELSKKLSNLTREFYEDLLEFVDINNYSNYIYYIKEQTNFYTEEKELDTDIIKKTEIVHEKITNIEEKIKEHKDYLDETLKELINSKVDEKINQLLADSVFSNLSNKEKIESINKIILKI